MGVKTFRNFQPYYILTCIFLDTLPSGVNIVADCWQSCKFRTDVTRNPSLSFTPTNSKELPGIINLRYCSAYSIIYMFSYYCFK